MRLDRIRVPVANLAPAAQTFRALGFHLRGDARSLIANTPTGDLELTTADTRREIVLSTASPAPDMDPPLPLAFEVGSRTPPEAVAHPNGVLRLERVYIATSDLAPVLPLYAA